MKSAESADKWPLTVSIFAIIVSVGVAVFTFWERDKAKNRDITMQMYRMWTIDLKEDRYFCWEQLRKMPDKSKLQHSKLLEIDQWESIENIRHFIAELHAVWAADLLDKKLIVALIGDTLLSYFDQMGKKIDNDTSYSKYWSKKVMVPFKRKIIMEINKSLNREPRPASSSAEKLEDQVNGQPVVSWDGTQITDMAIWTAPGDFDRDGDVDLADLTNVQLCVTAPGELLVEHPACHEADLNFGCDVDLSDLVAFQAYFTGAR